MFPKSLRFCAYQPALFPGNNGLLTFLFRQFASGRTSWFCEVPMGPPDKIFGIAEAFEKDTNPKKVNMGLGAYRDDAGLPWVLPSVRQAEQLLFEQQLDKEYADIAGLQSFRDEAASLAFGRSCFMLDSHRSATVQTLSGTGALSLGAIFLNEFHVGPKVVYIARPTWPNHGPILRTAGLTVKQYRYHDQRTLGLDFTSLSEDISKIPERSIVLFQVCGHNPTAVDPTMEQWSEISQLIKRHNLLPFFDLCYQGFASGDVEIDAGALRLFVRDGHQSLVLAQSFAKNMGLYGTAVKVNV